MQISQNNTIIPSTLHHPFFQNENDFEFEKNIDYEFDISYNHNAMRDLEELKLLGNGLWEPGFPLIGIMEEMKAPYNLEKGRKG